MGALLLIACVIVACSDGGGESEAARALTDFGPYTFVEPAAAAESNLVEYIEESAPFGTKVEEIIVRSLRSNGSEVRAEAVAATFDLGEVTAEDFEDQMTMKLAPGGRAILDERASLVAVEGTATVMALTSDQTLIFLVGEEPATLKPIAAGILDRNS